jgi:hypothetical protein
VTEAVTELVAEAVIQWCELSDAGWTGYRSPSYPFVDERSAKAPGLSTSIFEMSPLRPRGQHSRRAPAESRRTAQEATLQAVPQLPCPGVIGVACRPAARQRRAVEWEEGEGTEMTVMT